MQSEIAHNEHILRATGCLIATEDSEDYERAAKLKRLIDKKNNRKSK